MCRHNEVRDKTGEGLTSKLEFCGATEQRKKLIGVPHLLSTVNSLRLITKHHLLDNTELVALTAVWHSDVSEVAGENEQTTNIHQNPQCW